MLSLQVREYAVDVEPMKIGNIWEPMEIGIWDIIAKRTVFQGFIQVTDPSLLHDGRLKDGYTEEKLRNGKTKAEIDELLRVLLPGAVTIFWNKDCDLAHFPSVKKYSHSVFCCMKRFSHKYGCFSREFGRNAWMKLIDAANLAGLQLDDDESFHNAVTDAKICGLIWEFLESQESSKTNYSNLVSRSDLLNLEKDYEQKIFDLSEEVRKLESLNMEKKDSDNEFNIPF